MTKMITAILLIMPISSAFAKGYDDYESDESTEMSALEKAKKQQVREITRGLYLKAGAGGAFYLGQFAGAVNPGTSSMIGVGQDFLDTERMSMAWELDFAQGLHNAVHYENQIGVGPYIQGDFQTYSFAGFVEWNTYPIRRWGIGLRAGGGMLISPLLMDEAYYNDEVLKKWGVNDPGYHTSPHPLVIGGPNLEYYSKLSHFSIGLDADFFYAIGFDMGAAINGNMKYTF